MMKWEVKSNFVIKAKLYVKQNYCNFNYRKHTKTAISSSTSNYMLTSVTNHQTWSSVINLELDRLSQKQLYSTTL